MISWVVVAWLIVVVAFYAPAKAEGLTAEQRRAKRAIKDVFPDRHEDDAVAVAWCESRLDPDARNGQFRGVLQMGAWERRTFGHGPGAYAQARAALKYFRVTGSDWSPWACRWAAS